MESILELIRFLKSNPEWLVILNLKRNVNGEMQYIIPDNSTFSKFAKRIGREKRCQQRELLGAPNYEEAK